VFTRCRVRPYHLALLIGVLAPAARAQTPPPRIASPFAPLADLMTDVDTGYRAAGGLKRDLAAADKRLKADRKAYLADHDRVEKLRKDVENAQRAVTGSTRKWLCNRYSTLHDFPSQCSDPGAGGVWVYVDADGKTRRWRDPTPAEIDAAARAAVNLELMEAKLAQAKDKLQQSEQALRADTERYNKLVDDLTAKSARLADPKRVLDDVAREAAKAAVLARASGRPDTGDEATAREVGKLSGMLGKVTGSGQCAVLVQAYTNVGLTKDWKPDGAVGKTGQVVPFAPIATFVGDEYPNKPRGNHAAILLERTRDGLLVFDQYSGKTGGMRVIRSKGGTAANQALIDKGEQEAADKNLTEADGKAYYDLKYKYYSPSNDADNYSYIKRPSSP
jgi:hypothetical protein